MNHVTIPFLVDGAELAQFHLMRTHVGPDGVDTYTWEWGITNTRGYRPIDSGEVQHGSHLGLFALCHRILGTILCKKEAR